MSGLPCVLKRPIVLILYRAVCAPSEFIEKSQFYDSGAHAITMATSLQQIFHDLRVLEESFALGLHGIEGGVDLID